MMKGSLVESKVRFFTPAALLTYAKMMPAWEVFVMVESRDSHPIWQVISASRRTDIPAFYMRWFMNRLREGRACVPNPFGGQVQTVSLRPEDVHSIVFWSKHYGPLLPHIDELEARGYPFYCHYTITGAPRLLEPHVPDWGYSAEVLRSLAARIGPRRVQWRFDPIVFTDRLGPAFYLERFEQIAAALRGATTRCYFSFASFYGKAQRHLQAAGVHYIDPPLDIKRRLVRGMADLADAYGITLHACCQDALLSERVHKAHCVDADLLAELFPDRPLRAAARPTREECGCFASRDLGTYDTCGYGCLYCYATSSPQTAQRRLQAHDPASEFLVDIQPAAREVANLTTGAA